MHILRLTVMFIACTTGVALSEEAADVGDDGYTVETSVYTADDEAPILRTTTVFLGRRAYDVVHGESPQVARFDFQSQEVAFLATDQKKFAKLDFADVLGFQAEQRSRALKRGGFAAFLADPTFINEFDANNSSIKLSSQWMVYEAQVSQASFDDVDRFVTFADWSARVAGMLHPSAPPASARIALNKALKKQNWLPSRITRSGGPRAKMFGVIHSKHVYREVLSPGDKALTEGVEKDLKKFTPVSFSEFRSLRNPPRDLTKK